MVYGTFYFHVFVSELDQVLGVCLPSPYESEGWTRANLLCQLAQGAEAVFLADKSDTVSDWDSAISITHQTLAPLLVAQPRTLGPTDIVNWPWSSPLTHREGRHTLAIHMKGRHSETHKNTTKETHSETLRNTQK